MVLQTIDKPLNNFILLPCDTTVKKIFWNSFTIDYVINSFQFNFENDMDFW